MKYHSTKRQVIVFPFGITSVNRDRKNIVAQKATGLENVLQRKAGLKNFPETNLTVITADGTPHHFTVNYAKEVIMQNITIADKYSNGANNQLILVKDAVNARDIENVLREPSNSNQPMLPETLSSKRFKLETRLQSTMISSL